MDPTRKITSFTRSDTLIRNSPKSSVSSGIPSCLEKRAAVNGKPRTAADPGGGGAYVVRVELAVPGQAVQKSLDVRPEDAVQSGITGLVQMLSEAVPEVKGDLHHLDRRGEPR